LLPCFAHWLAVEGVEEPASDKQDRLIHRPRNRQCTKDKETLQRPGHSAVDEQKSNGPDQVGPEHENSSPEQPITGMIGRPGAKSCFQTIVPQDAYHPVG
jgi:hypothetical protein